jgi:hypothetical protein
MQPLTCLTVAASAARYIGINYPARNDRSPAESSFAIRIVEA